MRRRASSTVQRKFGFVYGASPVKSKIGIFVRASTPMHALAVSRVMISRRSLPPLLE
jgi:hypothetical protein